MGPLRRFASLFLLFALTFTTALAQTSGESALAEDSSAARDGQRAVPRLVRFSGALHDTQPRGSAVGLTFAIYAEHQGGAPLWLETQNVVLDEQGRYSVLLGRTAPDGLPQKLFATGEARWLGVRVTEEGAAEQPRVALVSVPYALTSADAQTLGGRPASDFQLTRAAALAAANGDVSGAAPDPMVNSGTAGFIGKFTNTVDLVNSVIFESSSNIGIGTTSPTGKLHVVGNINVSSGNLDLPSTTASVGLISLAGTRFVHGFGTTNAFVGRNAGNLTMSGISNAGFGYEAFFSNTTGAENTAMGVVALRSNTIGGKNTAMGAAALYTNTAGDFNTAYGYYALFSNIGGANNTATGNSSLYSNSGGGSNVAVGSNSLYYNTNGSNNTALGFQAGSTATIANANVTGSNNTFIGSNAGPGTPTQLSNAAAIGANAVVTASNSMVLGSGANVGIGTTAPASPLHVEANNAAAAMRIAQNNVNGYALLVLPSNDATPAFLMNNAANTANKHVFYGSGDAGLALGGGRIGIGTTGPASPLHVDANNTSAAVRIVQNNPNGFALLVQPGNDGNPAFLMNNAANTANRHVFYGSGEALFALGGGNVGIGTNAPSQKLHVTGQVYSSSGGFRFPDNTVQTTAASGNGDITGVTAGNGLAGGGASGEVAVNVKPCAEGQILKYTSNVWTCAGDQTGAGGITYPYASGNQSTTSGAFTVVQTNSVQLMADPTFSSAQTNIPAAVVGFATATSNTAVGVAGFSSSPASPAVVGWNGSTVAAQDTDASGVLGLTDNPNGAGVTGEARATSGVPAGVRGWSYASGGIGVHGGNEVGGLAGRFDGQVQIQGALTMGNVIQRLGGGQVQIGGGINVTSGGATIIGNSSVNGSLSVSGTLNKGGGTFKIDHPLDPANKYLYHSFVESPDMMNIYNGIAQLDARGEAWITMPEWFEALNMDFRYQLTPLGRALPNLHIAREMKGNRFKIAGGKPNARVSWQVTGVRQDAWANANRVRVEVEKPPQEQGTYLYPELFERKVVAKKQ